MPTSDDYARATIKAGTDLGVTPRGIKIGLATNLVEAGPTAGTGPGPILMYANPKVPESLKIPHDALASDGYSVGTFQQQIRRGNGGAWWWADAATCMDPYQSAVLFFRRLLALDYNNTNRSPGSYAQAVQGSSFPDRYDQRWAEASALYERLSGGTPMVDYGITKVMHGYNANSAGIGNSNGPRASTPYWVLHTQQAKSTAVNLALFCNNSAGGSNPVAYNLAIDGRDTVEIVPLNEGPWAAGDANNLGIHACFAGSFAEWTRGQWLDAVDDSGDGLSEDMAITRMAKALAAGSVQYGIPLEYAGDGGRSGWPVRAKGVVGHMDFGVRGGGHTDPGREFIDGVMSALLGRARAFLAPAQAPPNLIELAASVAKGWIGKRTGQPGEAGETILRSKSGAEIGRFVKYENAHVYWRKGERFAYVVPHGGLFEAWADLGWETGPLGFPNREWTKLPEGAVQAFQGGVLYRKDGKPGFYVTGVIGARYLKEGAETSDLGYPTSLEYDNGTGGRAQNFEGGRLDWDPSGSVKTILKGDA